MQQLIAQADWNQTQLVQIQLAFYLVFYVQSDHIKRKYHTVDYRLRSWQKLDCIQRYIIPPPKPNDDPDPLLELWLTQPSDPAFESNFQIALKYLTTSIF